MNEKLLKIAAWKLINFFIALHTQRNLQMEASVSTVKSVSLNFQLN